jgi:hypothetical protein
MDSNKALARRAYNYERNLVKKYWIESVVLTFTLALLTGTVNPIRLGLAFLVYPNLVPLIRLKANWSDDDERRNPPQ